MERQYRTYTYVLATAAALAVMFSVSGCGDANLASSSDTRSLKQHIFVLPDRFSGQPYQYGSPIHTVYLDTNESVKFWASYTVDDVFMHSDTADNHYLSHSWILEGEEYNISPLRYSFKTSGHRQGILQTVDLFLDTLRDTLNIFVNTPIGIALVAPDNGYNQVKPGSDGEVELRWALKGLDPWEASECKIYASYNENDVWKHNLGFADCFENAKFVGPFLYDSLLDYLQRYPEQDTTVTIYWGLTARFFTADGFEEVDTTDIFQFSTLYLHEDSSVVSIPIAYKNYTDNAISTEIIITDNKGDTVLTTTRRTNPSIVRVKVAPQTGLHIYAQELLLKEFQAEPVIVNTSPGALTTVDTIWFYDKIQPQVLPYSSALGYANPNDHAIKGDSIYFYALDNGTGINKNKIVVSTDKDTLTFLYEKPFIKFKTPCLGTCNIRVQVEDFAHNTSPRHYWIYSWSSIPPTLRGPYSETGGDK